MQGMTSDQRRRIVQSQAQQDGHWLHGVVWFENETEADLLAMAHAIGDSPERAQSIRELPDEVLGNVGWLAMMALRELAFRAISRRTEAVI